MSYNVAAHPAPLSRAEVESLTPANVHEVLQRTMLADGLELVYDPDKSRDLYLYDSRTGKEYLDFFTFFASWPLSHNHPKMLDPNFIQEIGKIATINPSNSDIYTVHMAKFVATFERVAMPPEFKHVFFISGGALAVENALKTAFDWKVRKNLAAGRGEKGSRIIHFREAFHGRSGYTMSLTNTDPVKIMYFPKFTNWPRIDNPKARFPLEGENLKKTIEAEEAALKQIREALEAPDGDEIAAIILEPIQAEGGDHHFRPEFWHELRKIADKYEVLLIADEVQSGMGITGKMWAWQHYGAIPDIVCFGKKSQVCGIMATSRIDEVKDNVFQLPSRINSTWGGSLVDMVRSRRLLEIIEEENLVANAASVGKYLLEKLEGLQTKYPKLLSNVRGRGLMCAFDMPSGEHVSKLRQLCYSKGCLILSCGTKHDSVRLRPPLDLKVEHVDKLISILDTSLAELE